MELAIAAAGAWAGSAMGWGMLGMTGAQIGWMAGSMLGSVLFPSGQDMQGPRLTDLSIPSSTYGSPIPDDYGTVRHSGVTIWESGIIEHSHEESQGKGDGPTYTTYTYTRHFAIALCNGEIDGVSRIWRNSALIYDVTPGNDGATGSSANIRIYTGSETQLPDSLMEGYLGVDDTPAYRGTAYVVFEDHDVTDIGGRVPIFSFEIVKDGTWATTGAATSGENLDPYCAVYEPESGYVWVRDITRGGISLFDPRTLTFIRNISTGIYGVIATPVICSFTRTMWVPVQYGATAHFKIFSLDSYAEVAMFSAGGLGSTLSWGIYNPVRKSIIVFDTAGLGYSSYEYDEVTYAQTMELPQLFADQYGTAGDSRFWTATTSAVWLADYATITWQRYDFGTLSYPVACHDEKRNALAIIASSGSTSTLYRIDYDTGMLSTVCSITHNGVPRWMLRHVQSDSYLLMQNDGALRFLDPETGALTASTPTTPSIALVDMASWVDESNCMIYSVSTVDGEAVNRQLCPRLTSAPVALSTIVSDRCLKSGLTAGEIDVTQLTDLVHGYTIGQPMTGRASIEPLQAAYFFDAVESEGKIKFVKRGGVSGATIAVDDLAAHEWGQSVPDDIVLARKQEVELPQQVSVVYADINMDYQPGAQYSRRLTGESIQQVGLQLPISMDADKAQQVADVNLYAAWEERNTAQIVVSRKWSHLEPTDVVDLSRNDVAYRLRIIKKDEGAPGLIRLDVVTEAVAIGATAESDAYISTSTGIQGSFTPQTMSEDSPTYWQALDIPCLRDQDSDAGFYVAACGIKAGWAGAQIFKSSDGITYTAMLSLPDPATMGATMDVMGNFAGGNIFDESSTVSIYLRYGTLSSTTALGVLNGENVAVIGSEIVQFKTATLTAANTYTLSGLLRGRFGTEWAISSHAAGERFVLASSNTWRRAAMDSSEIGIELFWKAVTFGALVSETTARPITHGAVALECYSPTELGAGWNATGDIALKWVRRNRINGAWRDYVDVPMSESIEAYEVDIYDTEMTTLKRTITGLSSPATTYTAAQQTTDFGYAVPAIGVKVYQISVAVGRGYPLAGGVGISNRKWRLYITDTVNGNNPRWTKIAEIEMMISLGGADVCAGGVATSWGVQSAANPSYAFDNNNATDCQFTSNYPSGDVGWIEYQFTSGQPIIEYTVRASATSYSNMAPKAWRLEVFEDGEWITKHTVTNQTGWTISEKRTFTI